METSTPDGRAGLLLVDKPAGVTSHDVVAIVRRATQTSRAGHSGTLDPFATGLLVILVGRGTRLIPYIDGDPKVYDAVIRFGWETDTDDGTGDRTREAPPPNDAAISAAVGQLTGEIDQTPPAYSAKKVGGTRAYTAARRGAPLSLAPASVMVHGWTNTSRTDNELSTRITCNGGTYIRALARDLGRQAGSAAHLSALRRVRSGSFDVTSAATLDQLKSGDFTIAPLRAAIPSMPVQRIDAVERGRITHGNFIDARTDAPYVALIDDDETLIAVAQRSGEELKPAVVLRDA